jgi:hypothetical protein
MMLSSSCSSRLNMFYIALTSIRESPPTVAMTEILVKILVELLSTLALATKEVKQGKPSQSYSPSLYTT